MRKMNFEQMENFEGGFFGSWIVDDPCQGAIIDTFVNSVIGGLSGGVVGLAIAMGTGIANQIYHCR